MGRASALPRTKVRGILSIKEFNATGANLKIADFETAAAADRVFIENSIMRGFDFTPQKKKSLIDRIPRTSVRGKVLALPIGEGWEGKIKLFHPPDIPEFIPGVIHF